MRTGSAPAKDRVRRRPERWRNWAARGGSKKIRRRSPGVQQLPTEDAIESIARVQAAPAGEVPLICDTLHMWEWDVRVLDIQGSFEGDVEVVCVSAGSDQLRQPVLTIERPSA